MRLPLNSPVGLALPIANGGLTQLGTGIWNSSGETVQFSGAIELIDGSNAVFQRIRFMPAPGPGTRKFYQP